MTIRHWASRLPFYYGWLIIAIAFVTMAIAVTARTAFSLLLPPLLSEYGWDRALVAGAFSLGFLFSAVIGPIFGRVMDLYGPRVVIGTGIAFLSLGLLTAPFIERPWQLYATLGVLVSGGANLMTYTTHSLFLPNWFVRRRALAISIAFSGVGVGAITLLPWLQTIIDRDGWRASCTVMGVLVLVVIGPLTLLVRHRPQNIGLEPDGRNGNGKTGAKPGISNIVDPAWAAIEWTLPRAMRTLRFWWIGLGYFCGLIAWYGVQVHQTKYLTEVGFTPLIAAWSLGLVSVVAIPGQILLGALSDRIGREWIWTAGCCGFVVCCLALIGLEHGRSDLLLYVVVIAQGFLGYALTSVMGPIAVEIFEGRHFGSIFGALSVPMLGGGAVGPWLAGAIYDRTGSYRLAFWLIIGCCVISAAAMWIAAPRKVRMVPGRVPTAK